MSTIAIPLPRRVRMKRLTDALRRFAGLRLRPSLTFDQAHELFMLACEAMWNEHLIDRSNSMSTAVRALSRHLDRRGVVSERDIGDLAAHHHRQILKGLGTGSIVVPLSLEYRLAALGA